MARKKSATKKAREAAQNLRGPEPKIDVVENKVAPVKKQVEYLSPESESSSSEDEDDFGELVTEEVEDGINQVLAAIKNNDTDKLLNPEVRFFEDPVKAVSNLSKSEKQKPIYLKDYHRMNILAGETFADNLEENENGTVDGKQSYVAQQTEEKEQLLSEIKKAFGGSDSGSSDEDAEDDFLTKKEPTARTIESKLLLPDPNANEENFLDEFVNQQAWIPKRGDKVMSGDGEMKIEEDDEDFENAVETFEHAYNFRYEDPNAAEIVSYARNQATLRRSDNSSRRRKRDEGKEVKIAEKNSKEVAIQKKKTEKVHKVSDVLEQLGREYGAEINEKMVKKITDTLLNNDFKDNEWDQVVTELFNEEFYQQESKPTWDDEDDIMGDIKMDDDSEIDEAGSAIDNEEEYLSNSKSRKDKKNEKRSKKQEKKKLNELVENAVEQNKLAIVEEVEQEQEERKSRLRTKGEQELKFRYREVSPESFGLTTREIFAADDTQLNQFIGLKKFAPYRPKELRMKDKRKVTKSRRLRDWRKEVFNKESGLTESGNEYIEIPVENQKRDRHHKDKKRKHEKHRKHND